MIVWSRLSNAFKALFVIGKVFRYQIFWIRKTILRGCCLEGFGGLYLDVCFKLLARDVYRGNSWPALPDNGRLAQNYDNVDINQKPHCGVAGRCQRFVSSRLTSILFKLQNSFITTQLVAYLPRLFPIKSCLSYKQWSFSCDLSDQDGWLAQARCCACLAGGWQEPP